MEARHDHDGEAIRTAIEARRFSDPMKRALVRLLGGDSYRPAADAEGWASANSTETLAPWMDSGPRTNEPGGQGGATPFRRAGSITFAISAKRVSGLIDPLPSRRGEESRECTVHYGIETQAHLTAQLFPSHLQDRITPKASTWNVVSHHRRPA